jgi:hypothetical protein
MTVISRTRPIGITAVSIFAIISGLGEVVVGFKGNSSLRSSGHPLQQP